MREDIAAIEARNNRYISCAADGIQVSCCKAILHGNLHLTSQGRECVQLSALIVHIRNRHFRQIASCHSRQASFALCHAKRSYGMPDTGYVRHIK